MGVWYGNAARRHRRGPPRSLRFSGTSADCDTVNRQKLDRENPTILVEQAHAPGLMPKIEKLRFISPYQGGSFYRSLHVPYRFSCKGELCF